jgi:ribose transport system ATP-binding protein
METTPAIRVTGLTKSFRDAPALAGMDLRVAKGTVHALFGASGAGKSLLLDVLLGLEKPGSGTVEIGGVPLAPGSIDAARAAGVAMVSEDAGIVPALTIAENVFLNREPRNRFGFIDRKACVERTAALLAEQGIDARPEETVSSLDPLRRRQVSIAKALALDPAVLLQDLPEKPAPVDEDAAVYAILRRLAERGLTTLAVIDRAAAVRSFADAVTVLRGGRAVYTGPASLTLDGLTAAFTDTPPPPPERPFLEIADGFGTVLTAGLGEVLGIAAPPGSPLIRRLTGIDAATIRINGADLNLRTPEDAVAAGVHLVPAARLIAELDLRRKVAADSKAGLFGALGGWGGLSGHGGRRGGTRSPLAFLQPGASAPPASGLPLAEGEIRDPENPPPPRVLILDGVAARGGTAARAEVQALVRETARQGHAVILTATDPLELLATADRLAAEREGHWRFGAAP